MTNNTLTGLLLRQFILRRVGVLVVATAVLVVVGFTWFGLLPMAEQIAKDQFDTAAARVESGLRLVFEPPVRLLAMGHGWLAGKAPDLASPQAFNQVFKPVLEASPELTSVVAGTSGGQGWLLLQQEGGRWRNRMSDVSRWGSKRHLLLDEMPDGAVRQQWSDQTYDPRQRPWFSGAMALKDPNMAHWTQPYVFFTTGDPGITVSTRTRLADGRDFVLGLDLMLRDLSRTTQEAVVGVNGMALVLTSDDRVLALPAAPGGVSAGEWLKKTLQPSTNLNLPQVSAALARWRLLNCPQGDVLAYESGGRHWLASVRPYALGGQQLWVLVLAPATDFAPAWRAMALALLAILGVVLAIALWFARAGAVRLSHPLEVLADNSRRIGRLDFEPQPDIHSRVTEIQQLASSQKSMLGTLRDNQQELDTRAEELLHQVSALRATEDQLNRQNGMLQTIIENFPGGLSVVDAHLQVVAFNTQFQNMLALPDELLKRPGVLFEDVIRYNAQRGDYGPTEVEALVAQRVEAARRFEAHRFERTLASGVTLEVRGMPLPQGGFVTLYIDVTAAKVHERELEHLAHFDALTGLPNRVLLVDRLRQAMAQVARRSQQLGVAYLDLDGFKAINDAHGHGVGDLLLVGLASRMRQALRDVDTLARMGGDEFVVVLMDVAGLDESTPMLRRLLLAADAPIMVAGHELRVSASVGVTFYPQSADVEAEQLVRQADQAMYQAKQAGKNRYHVFDTEQDRTLRGQFESLKRIAQALQDDELVLYYQPKVNMRTGLVTGAEALIRWQHPQQGLLSPALFLPIIEDDPLAISVGEWVIRTALTQLATWQAGGLALSVSVNVGARQMQHGGFVAFLRSALAAQPQINPADLQLEMLETSALQDMTRVTEVMVQCRALGVHFALDDFGTGYSSLTYLKRLPASQLKIDQSFVRDMLDDPDDLSILIGVLDLSTSFHRQVIAEGVETVAHGVLLLQLGCDHAQGYGIARPMPSVDLPAWVAGWQPDVAWQGVQTVPRTHVPLLFAQVEHRAWLLALQAFLRDERLLPPQLNAQLCHVGALLQAGGLGAHLDPQAVAQVEAAHHQVHDLATHLCALKAQGQGAAALSRLAELCGLRDTLLMHLQALLPQREA